MNPTQRCLWSSVAVLLTLAGPDIALGQANRAVQAKLDRVYDVRWSDFKFSYMLQTFGRVGGLQFDVQWPALEKFNLRKDTPLNIAAKGATIGDVLGIALIYAAAGDGDALGYTATGKGVTITTAAQLYPTTTRTHRTPALPDDENAEQLTQLIQAAFPKATVSPADGSLRVAASSREQAQLARLLATMGPATQALAASDGLVPLPQWNGKTEKTLEQLQQRVTVKYTKTSLRTLCLSFGKRAKVNITPIWPALTAVGVSQQTVATVEVAELPALTALDLLTQNISTEDQQIIWLVHNGFVLIGPAHTLAPGKTVACYDVRDLLADGSTTQLRDDLLATLEAAGNHDGSSFVSLYHGALVVRTGDEGHVRVVRTILFHRDPSAKYTTRPRVATPSKVARQPVGVSSAQNGRTQAKAPQLTRNDRIAKAISEQLELATLFYKTKQTDKAIALLQEIVTSYPDHDSTHQVRELLEQWQQ